MVTLSVSKPCERGEHDKCPVYTIAQSDGIGDGWACFCLCHDKQRGPVRDELAEFLDAQAQKPDDPE